MFFNFQTWLTEFFVDMVTDMANFISSVVQNVFMSDAVTITGETSTADLEVVEAVGNIVLVLALPLTVAAVIWQVIRSSAEGRLSGIWRAVIGGVLMVVLSRFAFWYGPVLISGFDDLTTQLISAFNSAPGGITDGLLESFGFEYNPTTDIWSLKETSDSSMMNPTWMAGIVTGSVIPILPLAMMIILAIGALLVMIMLAFRRWALIVLLAMAPLALMFLPAERASKGIGLKWLQTVAALLAAKPLAALILAVTSRLLVATGEVSLLMLLVALVSFLIAAAAPLIAMKFFGFLSMEIGHSYAQAAGEGAMRGGARGATQTASQAASLHSNMTRGSSGGAAAPVSGGASAAAPARAIGGAAASGSAVGGAAAGSSAAGGAAAAGASAASGPAAPVVAVAAVAASKRKKP